MGTFVAVKIALFAVQLGTVFWVAETQEVEAADAEGETEPVETPPTETETAPTEHRDAADQTETAAGETETTPTETETAPTETETESAGGDAAAGKRSSRPRAAVPATALGRAPAEPSA